MRLPAAPSLLASGGNKENQTKRARTTEFDDAGLPRAPQHRRRIASPGKRRPRALVLGQSASA